MKEIYDKQFQHYITPSIFKFGKFYATFFVAINEYSKKYSNVIDNKN